MTYSLSVNCWFDEIAATYLLKYYFSGQLECQHIDRLVKEADRFCYVAISGNNKIVKIGITSKPEKRLIYSERYFGLGDLRYLAIFPGCLNLEFLILYSLREQKLNTVRGLRSIEWFANKGKVKELLCVIRDHAHISSIKKFSSF